MRRTFDCPIAAEPDSRSFDESVTGIDAMFCVTSCVTLASVPAACPSFRATALSKGSGDPGLFLLFVISPPHYDRLPTRQKNSTSCLATRGFSRARTNEFLPKTKSRLRDRDSFTNRLPN